MLVTEEPLLDAAGRPRSPATMPGYHAGHPSRNKGIRYPADPPRVEEIVAVMRQAGAGIHGARLRGLIVVLWRAGLRISEALSLASGTSTRVAGRCSFAMARAVSGVRSGWMSGAGSSFARGSSLALACRSARSSASSMVRRAGGRGLARLHERSCGAAPSTLA
jgi:hypothetical protein